MDRISLTMRTMANNPLDRQIRARIDSFLAEMSGLVKLSALDAVRTALGQGAPPRRGPDRPRKVSFQVGKRPGRIASRGLSGKRTSAQVDATAARLLTEIRSKPGRRLEEIGAALKTPTSNLKLPIAKLMAARKLKTKGQKRGTKYFVK